MQYMESKAANGALRRTTVGQVAYLAEKAGRGGEPVANLILARATARTEPGHDHLRAR